MNLENVALLLEAKRLAIKKGKFNGCFICGKVLRQNY